MLVYLRIENRGNRFNMFRKCGFIVILLVLTLQGAFSQKNKNGERDTGLTQEQRDSLNVFIQIDRVFVVGNKRTKEKIIRRELDIYEGQTLTKGLLGQYIEEGKRKLFNTGLFNEVEFTVIDLLNGKADVIVRLSERWYFFPAPIFKLADRNFTEWWVNQRRDLGRVEYGVRFRHYNFRGLNEKIDITTQLGFTKLFSLQYIVPYLDKQQKVGASFAVDYATNKNIALNTENHRLQFYDSERVLRRRFRSAAYLDVRPSFYNFHRFGIWFTDTQINDSVALRNPEYLGRGRTEQKYFGLSYRFRRDLRDYRAYPLTGFYIETEINKYGLGVFDDLDILELKGVFSRFLHLGKKYYFSTSASFLASFPEAQPYRNFSGLGFDGRFVRGYEEYVIEGPHLIMNNNSFRKEVFSTVFNLSDVLGVRQFNKMPVAIYLTAFYDHGYVKNYPNYELNKKFTDTYLYGTGLGIDLVTFYDAVFRWEYSINKAGETGFRLNIHAAF